MKKLTIIIVGLIALIIAAFVLIGQNERIDYPDYIDPNPNETIASVDL